MKEEEGVVSAEIFVSVSEGQLDEKSFRYAKKEDSRYVGVGVVGDGACERQCAKLYSGSYLKLHTQALRLSPFRDVENTPDLKESFIGR
jgi:hypothetical protein